MTAFAPTTHIQHTTQCAQHTDQYAQSIAPRHDHTQHLKNRHLIPLWTPLSQLSQETLNVFVQDGGRQLQIKICVDEGFSEKQKGIQNSILKSVRNQFPTKNHNLKRIHIGSQKSVTMVTNFGSKRIQQLSIIRVITVTRHHVRTRISKTSFHRTGNNKYIPLTSKQIRFPTNQNDIEQIHFRNIPPINIRKYIIARGYQIFIIFDTTLVANIVPEYNYRYPTQLLLMQLSAELLSAEQISAEQIFPMSTNCQRTRSFVIFLSTPYCSCLRSTKPYSSSFHTAGRPWFVRRTG